jgi:WXG100 family type VII secretion target
MPMSGDHILVTYEDLQIAASQFNSKAAELEQMLQQVQSQIQSLASTWQGQAASQFAALMGQWTTDVNGIRTILGEISQHLNQAASVYQETDLSISRGFQS